MRGMEKPITRPPENVGKWAVSNYYHFDTLQYSSWVQVSAGSFTPNNVCPGTE
jgi:hypothetical protein